MRKKRITARKLTEQLEADPEFVRRRAIREARLEPLEKEYRRDQAELVAELRGLDYDIDSVWDLVNNTPHPVSPRRFVGPYDRAYPALARHLDAPHHPRVREGIIRALTVKDGGRLVQNALLDQFRRERDPQLRWVLANALRTAMPYRVRRKYPDIAEAYRLGGDRRNGRQDR